MQTQEELNQADIKQWLMFRYTPKQVESMLLEKGYDAQRIETYLNAYKKERSAKNHFNGFIVLGVGAFLGFASCLLSILNPWPDLYYPVLFGFTGLAICFIMAGLYLVFEG